MLSSGEFGHNGADLQYVCAFCIASAFLKKARTINLSY